MNWPTSTRMVKALSANVDVVSRHSNSSTKCNTSWKSRITGQFNRTKISLLLSYLNWCSCSVFSILLSFARRFWNQILIWVSLKFYIIKIELNLNFDTDNFGVITNCSASSNLFDLEMYSLCWNSSSKRIVWLDRKLVLLRLGLESLRLFIGTEN